MNWPLVSRRLAATDLAAAKAESNRLRGERDRALRGRDSSITAAATAARLFAEADAANTRLEGRIRELGRRLNSAHDDNLGDLGDITRLEAHAARTDARVRRLLKVAARLAGALRTSEHRADLLQARLDDAVGLTHPAVDAGDLWQSRRHDKPKPTAKESTS